VRAPECQQKLDFHRHPARQALRRAKQDQRAMAGAERLLHQPDRVTRERGVEGRARAVDEAGEREAAARSPERAERVGR
jgi:hypothetical protein